MGTLPQELVDLLIDFVSDDWRALAVCAHVHPDWAPRARGHLQNGVMLMIDRPDVDDFLRVFSPSSPLAPDVFTLSICGPPQPSLAELLHIPASLVLDHLPNLRSLTLRSVLVPGAQQFIEVLSSCLSLEELWIDTVGVDLAATSHPASATHAAAFSSPPRPCFARLKTLCIRCCDSELSRVVPLACSIASELAKESTVAPVQSLSFHLYARAPATTSIAKRRLIARSSVIHSMHIMDAWHAPLLNMRGTLTDISATVPVPLDILPDSHDTVKRLPAAIIRCSHLRRLTLRYTPLVDRPAEHAPFMASLHKLLTYVTTQGPSADMLQKLEVLTVILPHAAPDVPPYEEELARFAQVLAEGPFPALACVRVGLEGALDDPVQGMVEQTAAALQPLSERGFEVDVAGLQEDEWELWCSTRTTA